MNEDKTIYEVVNDTAEIEAPAPTEEPTPLKKSPRVEVIKQYAVNPQTMELLMKYLGGATLNPVQITNMVSSLSSSQLIDVTTTYES